MVEEPLHYITKIQPTSNKINLEEIYPKKSKTNQKLQVNHNKNMNMTFQERFVNERVLQTRNLTYSTC